MRTRGLLLPAITLGVCLIGACTPPQTGEGGEESASEPEMGRAHTREPGEELTVIAGAEEDMARDMSATLFENSPIAVLAPAGDVDSQQVAAEVATSLGVPVLLAPASKEDSATGALAEELDRLGVETLLTIGEAAQAPESGEWETAPLDPDALELPAEVPSDLHGEPVPDTAALITDSPENAAAMATAEAAGVPTVEVGEEANLQASSEAIKFLQEQDPAAVLAVGGEFADATELDWQVRAARTGYELPGGGQQIFDSRHYVALYGTPGSTELGVLGHDGLEGALARVHDLSAEYQDLTKEEVVPAFEIIATIASDQAGDDGDFSSERSLEQLLPWVERAGEEGMVVILDLQPGRTDFLTQAKEYEELLKLPHVGLALDPEWRLKPDEEHLRQIGSVSSEEINEVSEWLAGLVNEEGLPPKMLVLHQFRTSMITDREDVEVSHPEVEVLIHADGQGSQSEKQATWRALHVDAPEGVAWGWKNFYEKDSPMLTPEQTLSEVDPVPELITYQ